MSLKIKSKSTIYLYTSKKNFTVNKLAVNECLSAAHVSICKLHKTEAVIQFRLRVIDYERVSKQAHGVSTGSRCIELTLNPEQLNTGPNRMWKNVNCSIGT